MALPVNLEEAKRHLRVTNDADDTLIQNAIDDAAGWIEDYTGHLLTEREVVEHFGDERPFAVRAWPVAADAVAHVTYTGSAGETVTTEARVSVAIRPVRLVSSSSHVWPIRNRVRSFAVRLTAGYSDPAAVPKNIRRAMLVMISAFFDDREGGDVFQKAEVTARRLCGSLRLRRL